MFIRKFGVKNFKIHRDTQVELYPITVFVGPNSGGKSAFFDAILNFSMVCRGNLSEAFNQFPYSFDALKHHGASSAARIGYEVELTESQDSSSTLRYSIDFSQLAGTESDPRYVIHNEDLDVDGERLFSRSDDIGVFENLSSSSVEGRSVFAALRRSNWDEEFETSHPLVAYCARAISRIGRYRLDPMLLARPGRVLDVDPGEGAHPKVPWLSYRGEDLAAVLYYLNETGSPLLQKISSRIAAGIEGFEGFEFNRVGSDKVGFSVRFSDRRGVVVAPNVSDGCLAMIGLVTLAYSPIHPPVLCIEEPENGLTPKALKAFYETVQMMARGEEGSATQVLLSSHSPFVIVDAWNGTERDFIYQCRPGENGATVSKFADAVSGAGALRTGGVIGLALAEQVMDGFRSS